MKIRKMNLMASNDMKGFTDLIAKHAVLSLGIISLICCFHDKFESIIIPRKFYIFWNNTSDCEKVTISYKGKWARIFNHFSGRILYSFSHSCQQC